MAAYSHELLGSGGGMDGRYNGELHPRRNNDEKFPKSSLFVPFSSRQWCSVNASGGAGLMRFGEAEMPK